MIKIRFDKGTIVLENLSETQAKDFSQVKFDKRIGSYRAHGFSYREIILQCIKMNYEFDDQVKQFSPVDFSLAKKIVPREHQTKALKAWIDAGKMGTISLPTGAGKTILAVMAIELTKRPVLAVVPTIDLLHQWQETLKTFFDQEIGGLGGGQKEILDITVATYESAHRMISQNGNRFGLIIFDEVHHLPAPQYQEIARSVVAPFRIGLSATVERSDGKESLIYELVGPNIYEGSISEMVSKVLSPYDVVSIEVELTEREKIEYKESRKIYTDFIRGQGINFSSGNGWMDFVMRSSRTAEGRAAMKAYRKQKQLANGSENKILEVWKIICKHREDKMIVFTDENKFAYNIGKEFLLPVLTHHTKTKERKEILDAFRSGEFRVVVTSKVLNEGVDVPDANVAVVLSGSGAVREHVQRLGRILRFQPGKRAVLYEVMSKGTGETSVSQRRRQHSAYQRSH